MTYDENDDAFYTPITSSRMAVSSTGSVCSSARLAAGRQEGLDNRVGRSDQLLFTTMRTCIQYQSEVWR